MCTREDACLICHGSGKRFQELGELVAVCSVCAGTGERSVGQDTAGLAKKTEEESKREGG